MNQFNHSLSEPFNLNGGAFQHQPAVSAGWSLRGHRGSRTSGSGAGWTSCISLQRLLSPDGRGQGNSPQKGSKLIPQRNLLWLDLHENCPQLTNRICLTGRRLVLPRLVGTLLQDLIWRCGCEQSWSAPSEEKVRCGGGRERERERKREGLYHGKVN